MWTPEGKKQHVKTREMVQRIGIIQFSTGNMRTGFEFFGTEPYSSCEKLGAQVQEWTDAVYATAKARIAAAVGRADAEW